MHSDSVCLVFSGNSVLQVPQQFYINADITNRAGRRVSLVWRDDIIEFDIADGATAQLRYKVLTYMVPPPIYKLFVVRYGTNVSDLINKDAFVTISATSQPNNITSAVCSSSKFLLLFLFEHFFLPTATSFATLVPL